MTNYRLSQTVSISRLPRDYLSLLKTSQKKQEPVVLLKHSRPVGALVAQGVLNKLLEIKEKWEQQKALNLIEEGDKEYTQGKTTTRLPD
jgi:hypothetical protein